MSVHPRLVPNDPLDVATLGRLIASRETLQLVWPVARWPFDEVQWRDALDPRQGHRSYWIDVGNDRIGHGALRRTTDPVQLRVSFLFVAPAHRGRGIGSWLMQVLEDEARSAAAQRLELTVRDYNPRARHIYTRAGFLEVARDGTAIQMLKNLAPPAA